MDWNTIFIEIVKAGLWLPFLGVACAGMGTGIARVIDAITRRRVGVVGENYSLPSPRAIPPVKSGVSPYEDVSNE